MTVNEKITEKITNLISSGKQLRMGNQHDQVTGHDHLNECKGWLTSANNIVHLIINNPSNPYRADVDKICSNDGGYSINRYVGMVCAILKNLLEDINSGLLTSIEIKTRALIFDDFLDHAQLYFDDGKYKEAGVISGVVFEDTIRSICRNNDIIERDQKLDSLITQLYKINILTDTQAKRARAAASVRTKATHAQWDDFTLNDADSTIRFTRELVSTILDK